MTKKTLAVSLLAALTGTMVAQEGAAAQGHSPLNHVFVIMMENHGYSQIVNNPNAPFINRYAHSTNRATNYFAIAHPSSHELPGSRGRIEFRCAQRQRS